MLLALAAPTPALAFDIPSGDPSAPASPAPVAPVAPAPVAASPAATAPVIVAVNLRPGARGRMVRDLQRELRRRGYRGVRVDGHYGRATKAAVRSLQKRLRFRVTGITDARFLRRMGLQATVTAAAPTPATTVPANLAAPVGARYLQTFPVVGSYTYSNDFGASRHQGRHEGNDIIAKQGTPVVAVATGTIKRMTRTEMGLGGIYIWLRDTRGNEYYYAHLSAILPGLQDGSRVVVGQVIGAVGQTGDARGTVDHLHFEVHPGGGGAVNPYTDLRAVDPKAR